MNFCMDMFIASRTTAELCCFMKATSRPLRTFFGRRDLTQDDHFFLIQNASGIKLFTFDPDPWSPIGLAQAIADGAVFVRVFGLRDGLSRRQSLSPKVISAIEIVGFIEIAFKTGPAHPFVR